MGYQVTLTKSIAGAPDAHLRTVVGLGLKKMGDVRLLKDSPETRGMVFQVRHLVRGEKVAEDPKPSQRRKPRHVRAREAARTRRAERAAKERK
jgi:large subunit ribosomal protein L30